MNPRVVISKSSSLAKTYALKIGGKTILTPMGNRMQIGNDLLAKALENEWRSILRRKKLDLPAMNLTTLVYEAIDNPFNESKQIVVSSILEYLHFDTVRFREADNPELMSKQSEKMDPIVDWFEDRFQCKIPIDRNAFSETSSVPGSTMNTIRNHLMSHERWPLIGVKSMTQNLKSYVLAAALTEKRLSTEEAVELARLETTHQTDKWSKVEVEHDIDAQCTNARVAAGNLFYHLSI